MLSLCHAKLLNIIMSQRPWAAHPPRARRIYQMEGLSSLSEF